MQNALAMDVKNDYLTSDESDGDEPDLQTLAEPQISPPQFFSDVIEGLTQAPKKLSPKYFYDEQGSALFDEICDLEEYYPYKTELGLLPKVAAELEAVLGKAEDYAIVEFGAGSLQKIRPLLDKLDNIKRFIAIDISGEHLRASCRQLQFEFSHLKIKPIEADFCSPVVIGADIRENKLGFFPGSTIGNFTPGDAEDFLQNARTTLGPNSHMLIGVDTKKSPKKLHHAYNDKLGVTAKFNLNILERINREMDTDLDPKKFEHYACYNAIQGRIEMHLVSLETQSVSIQGVGVEFGTGESIHTESSYKYAPEDFKRLAQQAGWQVKEVWLAEDDQFSTFLLYNPAVDTPLERLKK